MALDRFKRYIEKFKPGGEERIANKTLGEVMSEELKDTVQKKLQAIIPHFASAGNSTIYVNASSFWNIPNQKNQIVVCVLVTFEDDMVWKDGG